MTVDTAGSALSASVEPPVQSLVPQGWVKVPALEVPTGGAELRELLQECLNRGLDDPHDIADELGLDLGLIRQGLRALMDESSCCDGADAAEAATPEPIAQPSRESAPRPFSDEGRVGRARILVQKLDPARAASARLVLKAAATRNPLTLGRAKAITRLSGDEFEDILDDLVISGELVPSVDGTQRIWVRGG